MELSKTECKDLLILINRVPSLTPGEAHTFVALSGKLQAEFDKPEPALDAEQASPPAETA